MTLTYRPTRQRDRYRVFDGDRFLGVVQCFVFPDGESPPKRCWRYGPPNFRWWLYQCYATRTEAAEALREMRAA